VEVGAALVVLVGAKTMVDGNVMLVALSYPVGTIEMGAVDVVVVTGLYSSLVVDANVDFEVVVGLMYVSGSVVVGAYEIIADSVVVGEYEMTIEAFWVVEDTIGTGAVEEVSCVSVIETLDEATIPLAVDEPVVIDGTTTVTLLEGVLVGCVPLSVDEPVVIEGTMIVALLDGVLVGFDPLSVPVPYANGVEDLVIGTGMSAIPEEPIEVLKVYDPVEMPVPDIIDASVAVALTEAMVAVVSANEDAALDKMLEYSDASDVDTEPFVAVATMLENCELKEEAMDSSADVAAGAIAVTFPVPLLDIAEEMLEISETADGIKPEALVDVLAEVVVTAALPY
jgi:hypothetical protein